MFELQYFTTKSLIEKCKVILKWSIKYSCILYDRKWNIGVYSDGLLNISVYNNGWLNIDMYNNNRICVCIIIWLYEYYDDYG